MYRRMCTFCNNIDEYDMLFSIRNTNIYLCSQCSSPYAINLDKIKSHWAFMYYTLIKKEFYHYDLEYLLRNSSMITRDNKELFCYT